MTDENKVVLASTSEVRRRLLEAAGINVHPVPSHVDESAIKRSFGQISAADFPKLAGALAAAKAEAVSLRHPAALVIGADQLLRLDDRQIDKPRNLKEAATQLALLRGNTHELITAVAVARKGAVVWTDCTTANLTMRYFSDDFLNAYIDAMGNDALSSVGAYKIEGRGVQLFHKVEGDYFAILGLPLVPILSFLRREGCLPE